MSLRRTRSEYYQLPNLSYHTRTTVQRGLHIQHVLLCRSNCEDAPCLFMIRRRGSFATYEIVSSSTGGTVASLCTASYAVSMSKPVMFLRTASAISESAWVPTLCANVDFGSFQSHREAHHDIRLCEVTYHELYAVSDEQTCSPTIFFHIGSHPP